MQLSVYWLEKNCITIMFEVKILYVKTKFYASFTHILCKQGHCSHSGRISLTCLWLLLIEPLVTDWDIGRGEGEWGVVGVEGDTIIHSAEILLQTSVFCRRLL